MRPLRALRPRTALFYALVGLVVFLLLLAVIDRGSRPHGEPAMVMIPPNRLVVLDAGHGGQDGGATVDGISEAPINLAVTVKAALLMRFCGQDILLTRADDQSLDYDPAASVRANKNADLRARLSCWKQQPGNSFISIHLNQFSEEKYSGAQVFYSTNDPSSKALAETLQVALRDGLDPGNTRSAKPCTGVYLMEQITGTAVTVECGFLSNTAERTLLCAPAYQCRIALAVACGYLRSLAEQGSV